MATKSDLQEWVESAIRDNGGHAKLVEVAKHIWKHHESELKASGDLFYTWQYDIRWAANQLRINGILAPADSSPEGIWILKD